MAVDIRGYVSHEIIRIASGSPAVPFQFSQLVETVSLLNTGSSPVYYNFFKSGSLATTGSTSAFLDAGNAIDIDIRTGSVSVLGSGTTTPVVQAIGLY